MTLNNILQKFRTPYLERTYLGLERINIILNLLKNPHNDYPSIHIAGTNGKGSVSAMLNSVFIELDYKVGLFTSPHIERFTERIKINNEEITEKEFLEILNNKVLPVIEKLDKAKFGNPTEFEVINAVAFCYFSEKQVDLAIFEVGLGGRVDSTNVLTNVILSIITSISYDHTARLGNSLEQITYEKAGIIKENIPLVTTVLNEHKEIITNKTNLVSFSEPSFINTKNKVFDDNYIYQKEKTYYLKNGWNLNYLEPNTVFYNQDIFLPFLAEYQLENLALVIKSLDVIYKSRINLKEKNNFILEIEKEVFIKKALLGISKTKWSGRFEFFRYKNLLCVLDGAHNEEGIRELINNLKPFHKTKKIITIFACNKDKDYKSMLEQIAQVTNYFILTESHVKIKAQNLEFMSEHLKNLNKDHKIVTDYSHTIDFASKIVAEKGYKQNEVLVNICGSLYLVGAIRELINKP